MSVFFRLPVVLGICSLGLLLSANLSPALAQNGRSVPRNEPVTLNFTQADIEAVARTLATISGKNVIVDPRVRGQLTLVTEKPVLPAVAFQQFLAALRLQGFTVVESAGLYKVIPEADAKLQTDTVSISQGNSGNTPTGGQIVTQIFHLNFENAHNLVPVLRPLISPNNTINVNPGNNSLVITDYADNLQRLARIIAAMDVSNASDVEIIPLQHAIATDLALLVTRLLDGGSSPAAPPSTANGNSNGSADATFKTTLLPEPRSNALIVRAANPARLALVRSLVARLDQPAAAGSSEGGNIHVVYLKNADAVQLANTLRAALAAGSVSDGNSPATASNTPANTTTLDSANSSGGLGTGQRLANNVNPTASTGGIIQADPSTNSLIITAAPPLYRQIRAVIDQLDGRRAQVLIESLIVEVSANKIAEFGIQWQGVLGSYGSTLGVIGTNSSIAGRNILDLAIAAAQTGQTGNPAALAAARPTAGMNAAVAPRINGKYYLGALASFLENSGDANVLSTPNLMTLDNQEAQIIIGNNVPFPTGSYTNTGGAGGAVNPFTTVERKDVGLLLRVRPTINENGSVKLTLYQEVSKVNENTLANSNGPSTSKRSIESTVLVDDGSIIVIGGLLEDSYALGQDKVPVMGDVPLIGGLFRSERRTRQKTNLMVFLRPTVIRDTAASDTLALDRYEAIRALQKDSQPPQNVLLQAVSEAPVLPPLPATTESIEQPHPVIEPAHSAIFTEAGGL